MSRTGGSKPLLMSLPAFAAHLSISLSTLRRRVDEGIIPVLHEGRRVSVPVAIAEKRYMAYLLEQEKSYRAARRADTQHEPAKPPSLSDRAADIAEQVGLLDPLPAAGGGTSDVNDGDLRGGAGSDFGTVQRSVNGGDRS